MRMIAGLLAIALTGLAGTAGAQEVTLRAASAFQEGTAFSKPYEAFIAKVNQEGKGLVRINFVGGPRAIPPFEAGNAVRNGVVDMMNSTASFLTNLIPEADAQKLQTVSMSELRKSGGWEYLNKIYNEKLNAWHLARTGDNIPFHLYLTRPLDKADLNGLSIRVSPTYRAFFAQLGANLVNTAPGEVYTALDRGVVQGYGWPAIGIYDLGWNERTKVRVDPGFYNVEVSFLVNLDKWRSLSDQQRDFLTKTALAIEEEFRASNADWVKREYARQAESGIQTVALTGPELEKWRKTSVEAAWAEIIQASPQHGAALRKHLAP